LTLVGLEQDVDDCALDSTLDIVPRVVEINDGVAIIA